MSTDMKRTILVSGFGPFDKHAVNASWEAAKELQKLWLKSKEFPDTELIAVEIPVSYDYVSTNIPQFWKKHDPIIVLHMGVSDSVTSLTVECHAHSNEYKRPDVDGKCPDESNIECDILKTKINVKEVCDVVNKNSEKSGCNASASCNAGRYLCEYTYYHSLSIEPKRALFVHVPEIDKYPSTQTARGLYDILSYLIRNLKVN